LVGKSNILPKFIEVNNLLYAIRLVSRINPGLLQKIILYNA
jgi:hypothetical protein